ncbi:MAG: leucyl aminopeptidase family protein [Pontiellaceae bacterium]|jgi:leucyl aminopeptidase|nr:leucyl aminopeptidase family protein [Pontiellaceae bacterium]
MKFSLKPRPLNPGGSECRIVFIQDKKPLISGDSDLEAQISAQIKKTGFSGDFAQTPVFSILGKTNPEELILTGLGPRKHFRMEYLERAAAAALRAGKKAGVKVLAVSADAPPAGVSETDFVHAVARGAAWGNYGFNLFKTGRKKRDHELSVVFTGPFKNSAACRNALTRAELESSALLATADLANTPANEATPQKISDWAKKTAKENGLGFSSLNKAELKKKNCNALLAVAAGSAQDAKIITLEYKGPNPKSRPVVLIGKTITFDSGGISLKPGKGMNWMQYDKCGGMAVLAVMQMVAQLKPETSVIGMLAVAENMPGGSAARPGDIIKSHAGKTIEILNTDAEGRLILADALSLAQQHNPSAMVDIATLTGAVITALGHTAAAVLGNDPDLNRSLIRAGAAAGERFWEMPLWPEHTDDMNGTFADLQNIGRSDGAKTSTAAAFLASFVPETIPWAHLDIAGTAWEETSKPWMDPGATLFGARTLIEWINGL